MGDKLIILKDKNTVKLKDQMSAARATSAGRTSIMKTPESTELILDSELGLQPIDSECSKIWQSSKRYVETLSPKEEKNPEKPRNFNSSDDEGVDRSENAKLRRLLGNLGHTGIDIENIEPELKRKIKRALRMYDQADKVYKELFCKDEEAVKLEVIKEKSTVTKKKDK